MFSQLSRQFVPQVTTNLFRQTPKYCPTQFQSSAPRYFKIPKFSQFPKFQTAQYFSTKKPHAPLKYTPLIAITSAIHDQSESEILKQLQRADTPDVTASPQEKAILQQLVDKYGIDSDETKEFTLTTSDLSPIDEVRMLSPCGIFYTTSIFYSVLTMRFGLTNCEEKAKETGILYEQCLVNKVQEELHFWSKTREMAQISAGFVQSAKDHDDRLKAEENAAKKNQNIEETRNQAGELQKIAAKRVDLD